jgi:hypothetical protein
MVALGLSRIGLVKFEVSHILFFDHPVTAIQVIKLLSFEDLKRRRTRNSR